MASGGNVLCVKLSSNNTINTVVQTTPKVIIRGWDAYLMPDAAAVYPINVQINIQDFAQNNYYPIQLFLTSVNQIAQAHISDINGQISGAGFRVNFNWASGGGIQSFAFLTIFYESQ